jgi:hypothetical protein
VAAFTSPATHGFRVNGPTLGELLLGVRERFYALRATGSITGDTIIPAGGLVALNGPTDATLTKPIFWHLQHELEDIAPLFANSDAIDAASGGPVAKADWTYTLATWRSAAGLPTDGFRRATTCDGNGDPVFDTPGLIQKGDILGWWIWEDIVHGLQALRYTRSVYKSRNSEPYGLTSRYGTSVVSFADALSAYDASATQSASSSNYVNALRNKVSETWFLQSYASSTTWTFNTADVTATQALALPDWELWEWTNHLIVDYANPWSWQEDCYYLVSNGTLSAWGDKTIDSKMSSYTGDPLADLGLREDGSYARKGCYMNGWWILKWAFSNS